MMSQDFDVLKIPLLGTQLIEASAGTGKTYSITSLYLLLLLKRRLSVDQILVVTFTEAATAELRDRLRKRLSNAVQAFRTENPGKDKILSALIAQSTDTEADCRQLQRALTDMDEAMVSTIHGFCRKMLQHGAFESHVPFDLELVKDTDMLLQEIVEDYITKVFYESDSRLVAILQRNLENTKLISLAREAIRHSGFKIFPKDIDQEHIVKSIAEATKLYQKAQDSWQADRKEIRQMLDPSIFMKDVRVTLEAGLLDQLDKYLSHDAPPSFIVPSTADSLTQQKISDPKAKICKKTAIKKGTAPQHSFFEKWEQFILSLDVVKQTSTKVILANLAIYVRTELPQRMRAGQQQSFDDLLHSLDKALYGKGGDKLAQFIRNRYPVALIDEFQDTDPVQYRIFKTVYNHPEASLFLVGDPKQAIYGFRGADIYAYLKAAEDAKRYTMHTNYRSDPGIISSFNALFGSMEQSFFEERINYPKVIARSDATDRWDGGKLGKEPLQFLCLSGSLASEHQQIPNDLLEEKAPDLIAADIVQLLSSAVLVEDRPVKSGDIAVLVRTNKQAADIQNSLRRLGVSAVLHSKGSVYESVEAYGLFRLLRAVAEPSDERALRSAVSTDLYGMTVQELVAIDEDENKWLAAVEQFYRWHSLWQAKGFMQMAQAVSEELHFTDRLLPLHDGERKLTNIRHLFELLHSEERKRHRKVSSLVSWLAKQRKLAIDGNINLSEDVELRLESDEDAVQLVTIHKSKGLEYPIVYCPYLWQPKLMSDRSKPLYISYHDPTDDWAGKISLVDDDISRAAANNEQFAENIRLLYVALTRAKHCCIVLWAGTKDYHKSPLAYLLHGQNASPAGLDNLAEWFAHLGSQSADALFTDLNKRVGQTDGWSIRYADSDQVIAPLKKETIKELNLHSRKILHKIPASWRIGSFSQLTARAEDIAFHPEIERDHDELAGTEEISIATGSELQLALFPKGATAGNFFHKLFELSDFQEIGSQNIRNLVMQQMQAFGYSSKKWLEPVVSAFHDTLQTKLMGDPSFCLSDISKTQRLNELAFFFPVAQGVEEELSFAVDHLQKAFTSFSQNIPQEYLDRISRLGFPPLQGYLKGFIDLVFEYNGQWFIVDYKSNFLGEQYQDYSMDNLVRAMADHHYFLQYHIYTVAFHRYLSYRLPDYSYKKHFGGVFYLFIRGMSPKYGPDYGVFYDCPPVERIKILSALLAGPVTEEVPS